ncbi:MAG: hypothetical protein Q7T71_08215 [Herbiconiux sp.]|nr:hypothetical protein [Herbiconiux sp.]
MVELAAGGGSAAAGEATGLVVEPQQCAQRGRRSIAQAPGRLELTALVVDDDPQQGGSDGGDAPTGLGIDRTVPVQFTEFAGTRIDR